MVTTARLTMALLAAACAVQYASAFCARPAWAGASATARRRPPPPTMKLQLTPEPGCPWIEELEVDVEPVRVQNVIFRPRGPSNYVCVKDDDGVDSVAINGNTLMPATDYLLGDGQVTKRDSMKIRWSRDCGGPHPPPLPSSMPSEQEERAWGQRQRPAGRAGASVVVRAVEQSERAYRRRPRTTACPRRLSSRSSPPSGSRGDAPAPLAHA